MCLTRDPKKKKKFNFFPIILIKICFPFLKDKRQVTSETCPDVSQAIVEEQEKVKSSQVKLVDILQNEKKTFSRNKAITW